LPAESWQYRDVNALPSPAAVPSPQPGRLRYIDALRAIAALLVVWLHTVAAFGRLSSETEGGGGWLRAAVANVDVGHVGVVVFFLISGFVIPFSILPDRTAPVGSFAIKRLFRIYPAYWLSVPLAALTVFWIWGTPFSAREVLVNLTLLQDVAGVRPAEGVYWTLLVELVFYALCVVLLVTKSLFDMRRVALLAAALAIAFVAAQASYWSKHQFMTSSLPYWFLNLSVMFCGALFRGRSDAGIARRDRLADALLGAMVLLYVLALPIGAWLVNGPSNNTLLTYAIGFAIFVIGTRFVRIETRVSDWLGRISYSIYLFHVIVFSAIAWWLLKQPAGSAWRTQHLGVYAAVGLAAVLVVASLTYRFVEKPGIRLGHRLATAWQRRVLKRNNAGQGTTVAPAP
jgi:peptidoglycan/LPS O-acetylase OafA/YrhL